MKKTCIIVGMEIIDLSRSRCFVIKCSDWSVVIGAPNETEACTKALTEMLKARGKELKLSSVMVSQEITEGFMDFDDVLEGGNCAYDGIDPYEDLISYHSVSRMLANAGLHDLSVNLKSIFGS
jgi:hypothetical protein